MKPTFWIILLLGHVLPGQLAARQPDRFHWSPYDETRELEEQQAHENPRMRFKLLNSRVLDKNVLWGPFEQELRDFDSQHFERLKPLIFEQDIPALQRAIKAGQFSYEELVKFYLYRIRLLESNNSRSLNALIAINDEVLEIARSRDRARLAGLPIDDYSLFGIPVLLKDNIGTAGMATTAGAQVLATNDAADAFIARRLKSRGAIILGKANLSEWAYYFCDGCPLGYSAVGGQTLNPYGRKVFETGGSSSGSAVAVAANYVPVAVGSETSGSILSPASLNSTVGLKPTTGMLSRSGIVPISSSLDTPGPIAKSITDAVILFNAMTGYDRQDTAMPMQSAHVQLLLRDQNLQGRRLGMLPGTGAEPSLDRAIQLMRTAGAEVQEAALPDIELSDFGLFLGAEMKFDLASYLDSVAGESIVVRNVEEIVNYNNADAELRSPYGQGRFEAMTEMNFTPEQVTEMGKSIRLAGIAILGSIFDAQGFDALVSLNNFHASLAAAANFPALTIPLGLDAEGKPVGLTLIAPSYGEQVLVDIGLAFEKLHDGRIMPADYQ